MNYEEIQTAASNIAFEALPLFPMNAERVTEYGGESFTMYSYDALAKRIIQGIAEQMFSDGCTKDQVKAVLSSKLIRWKLNNEEQDLIDLGKKWAKEENWKNEFKEVTK